MISGPILALVAALALATPASAQALRQAGHVEADRADTAMHDMGWTGGMMALMGGDAAAMTPERVEARLASLQIELRITDSQLPRWRLLADALRADANHMSAITRPHPSSHASAQPQSLPDRLGTG